MIIVWSSFPTNPNQDSNPAYDIGFGWVFYAAPRPAPPPGGGAFTITVGHRSIIISAGF